VLLTIGNDLPLDVLGEVPSNVHVERFVPQDDVLPHAAAVVCHGGSGTVIGTLAAGLPMVVAPLGADQPDNAARVMQLGAGVGLPTGTATADQIREALSRVLEQAAFRTEAKRCADEIAALPEVSQAPAELERLVKAHAKDHA
jgi:MGT family glycosyltransferase